MYDVRSTTVMPSSGPAPSPFPLPRWGRGCKIEAVTGGCELSDVADARQDLLSEQFEGAHHCADIAGAGVLQ